MIGFLLSPVGRWVAAVVVIIGAFWSGRMIGAYKARQECRVADLLAERAELSRQRDATIKLLELARERAARADKERDDADKKVSEYEKALESTGDCGLTSDDVKRLRDIR